jgi:hypothetical protein
VAVGPVGEGVAVEPVGEAAGVVVPGLVGVTAARAVGVLGTAEGAAVGVVGVLPTGTSTKQVNRSTRARLLRSRTSTG